jgi:hypothetical protein
MTERRSLNMKKVLVTMAYPCGDTMKKTAIAALILVGLSTGARAEVPTDLRGLWCPRDKMDCTTSTGGFFLDRKSVRETESFCQIEKVRITIMKGPVRLPLVSKPLPPELNKFFRNVAVTMLCDPEMDSGAPRTRISDTWFWNVLEGWLTVGKTVYSRSQSENEYYCSTAESRFAAKAFCK